MAILLPFKRTVNHGNVLSFRVAELQSTDASQKLIQAECVYLKKV